MIPGIFLTMLEKKGDVKMKQKLKLPLCELQIQEILVKWSILKSFLSLVFYKILFPVIKSSPVP